MSLSVVVRPGESISAALARFRRAARRGGLFHDIKHASARYSPPSVLKAQQASRAKWKRKKRR